MSRRYSNARRMARPLMICAAVSIIISSLASVSSSDIKNPPHLGHDESPPMQANRFPHPIFRVRAATKPSEAVLTRQRSIVRKYPRDSEKAIRVTINDLRNRYVRLENVIGVLERVSYAISKPAAIIEAIRLFALALSSVLMKSLNVS